MVLERILGIIRELESDFQIVRVQELLHNVSLRLTVLYTYYYNTTSIFLHGLGDKVADGTQTQHIYS